MSVCARVVCEMDSHTETHTHNTLQDCSSTNFNYYDQISDYGTIALASTKAADRVEMMDTCGPIAVLFLGIHGQGADRIE